MRIPNETMTKYVVEFLLVNKNITKHVRHHFPNSIVFDLNLFAAAVSAMAAGAAAMAASAPANAASNCSWKDDHPQEEIYVYINTCIQKYI